MHQTPKMFASNAVAGGEAPSWLAAMLGHARPEMLFSVYARYIPNRTRRDGSALIHRMAGMKPVEEDRYATPSTIQVDRVH
jgi:integrase